MNIAQRDLATAALRRFWIVIALLVVLVLLLLGAVPTWPHSRRWGYAPSGTLGTILLIVLILMLMGRL